MPPILAPRAGADAPRRTASFRPGVAALALLASCAAVRAEAQARDPNARFHAEPLPTHAVQGLSAAESRALHAVTARVAGILRANRAVTSPSPGPWCTWLIPATPLFYDSIQRISVTVQGVAAPDGCARLVGNSGVTVNVNDIRSLRMPMYGFGPEPLGDAGGAFLYAPAPRAPLHGFPQFEVGNLRTVVLTRRAAPLWLPVSRERYIRATAADYEANVSAPLKSNAAQAGQDVTSFDEWLRVEKPRIAADYQRTLAQVRGMISPAELEKMRAAFAESLAETEAAVRGMMAERDAEGPPARQFDAAQAQTRRYLAALHAMLAAMTPAERAAPACVNHGKEPTDEDPTDLVDDCRRGIRVVTFNRAFFDPSLPPSTVQLLTVDSPVPHGEATPDQPPAELWQMIYQLYHTTDFAALAALLH